MKEYFIYFLYFLFGLIFLLGFLFLQLKTEGLLTENPFLNVSDISYNLKPIYDNNNDISYVNYQIGEKVNYNKLSYSLNDPSFVPLTNYNTDYNYDTNNYNVEYHDDTNIINDKYKMGDSGTWVKNPNGKLEFIKWVEIPKYPIYYTPGSLPYGPLNYIPSYQDTVYLKYYRDSLKNKK